MRLSSENRLHASSKATSITIVLVLALVSAYCAKTGSVRPTVGPTPAQSQSQSSSWRALFDGTSLGAWRGYQTDKLPDGWKIANGELTKNGSTGDLISKDQFGDFELQFEWKIGKGGNGGVFYRGTEEYEHIYWSAPEYQLLDDANAPDGKNRLTSAASAYALYAAPAGVVKPFGEWNTGRIVAKGAHVEHWLNGQKVVEYELWSPDWESKVAGSKFKPWPNYGRSKAGHIGIQGDHDGELALRSIRIRELK